MFKKEGTNFLPKYEEFLRLAGSDSAENVVKHTVGQDLEKPEFWRRAIRSLEEPRQRLEALLPQIKLSQTV
jgi:oligoendopeptidase F